MNNSIQAQNDEMRNALIEKDGEDYDEMSGDWLGNFQILTEKNFDPKSLYHIKIPKDMLDLGKYFDIKGNQAFVKQNTTVRTYTNQHGTKIISKKDGKKVPFSNYEWASEEGFAKFCKANWMKNDEVFDTTEKQLLYCQMKFLTLKMGLVDFVEGEAAEIRLVETAVPNYDTDGFPGKEAIVKSFTDLNSTRIIVLFQAILYARMQSYLLTNHCTQGSVWAKIKSACGVYSDWITLMEDNETAIWAIAHTIGVRNGSVSVYGHKYPMSMEGSTFAELNKLVMMVFDTFGEIRSQFTSAGNAQIAGAVSTFYHLSSTKLPNIYTHLETVFTLRDRLLDILDRPFEYHVGKNYLFKGNLYIKPDNTVKQTNNEEMILQVLSDGHYGIKVLMPGHTLTKQKTNIGARAVEAGWKKTVDTAHNMREKISNNAAALVGMVTNMQNPTDGIKIYKQDAFSLNISDFQQTRDKYIDYQITKKQIVDEQKRLEQLQIESSRQKAIEPDNSGLEGKQPSQQQQQVNQRQQGSQDQPKNDFV